MVQFFNSPRKPYFFLLKKKSVLVYLGFRSIHPFSSQKYNRTNAIVRIITVRGLCVCLQCARTVIRARSRCTRTPPNTSSKWYSESWHGPTMSVFKYNKSCSIASSTSRIRYGSRTYHIGSSVSGSSFKTTTSTDVSFNVASTFSNASPASQVMKKLKSAAESESWFGL